MNIIGGGTVCNLRLFPLLLAFVIKQANNFDFQLLEAQVVILDFFLLMFSFNILNFHQLNSFFITI